MAGPIVVGSESTQTNSDVQRENIQSSEYWSDFVDEDIDDLRRVVDNYINSKKSGNSEQTRSTEKQLALDTDRIFRIAKEPEQIEKINQILKKINLNELQEIYKDGDKKPDTTKVDIKDGATAESVLDQDIKSAEGMGVVDTGGDSTENSTKSIGKTETEEDPTVAKDTETGTYELQDEKPESETQGPKFTIDKILDGSEPVVLGSPDIGKKRAAKTNEVAKSSEQKTLTERIYLLAEFRQTIDESSAIIEAINKSAKELEAVAGNKEKTKEEIAEILDGIVHPASNINVERRKVAELINDLRGDSAKEKAKDLQSKIEQLEPIREKAIESLDAWLRGTDNIESVQGLNNSLADLVGQLDPDVLKMTKAEIEKYSWALNLKEDLSAMCTNRIEELRKPEEPDQKIGQLDDQPTDDQPTEAEENNNETPKPLEVTTEKKQSETIPENKKPEASFEEMVAISPEGKKTKESTLRTQEEDLSGGVRDHKPDNFGGVVNLKPEDLETTVPSLETPSQKIPAQERLKALKQEKQNTTLDNDLFSEVTDVNEDHLTINPDSAEKPEITTKDEGSADLLQGRDTVLDHKETAEIPKEEIRADLPASNNLEPNISAPVEKTAEKTKDKKTGLWAKFGALIGLNKKPDFTAGEIHKIEAGVMADRQQATSNKTEGEK